MELYGEDYYGHYCGPVPYDRSHDAFLRFFRTIAQHIKARLRPESVMDVGCAKGFLVEALRDQGIEAFGIDTSTYAISQVRPDMRPWCRVGSATEPLERSYSLITFIEVAEHLAGADVKLALDNVCRHAETVLFSSSPDDHYELTHVHVRPRSYWLSCFEERGFTLDRAFDLSFVAPWAMLFRRTGPARLHVAYYAFANPSSASPLIRVSGPMSHLSRMERAVLHRGCQRTDKTWAVTAEALRDADVVLVQREFPLSPAAAEIVSAARGLHLPVLYELDDLLTDLPPEHPKASWYQSRGGTFIEAIREADAVTVSSEQLRGEILRWNRNVFVLPNYLDDNIWTMEGPRRPSRVVTIGYAATPTHLPDIDELQDVLLAVARRYGSRVRFRFLGCQPAWAQALGEGTESRPFSEDYRWTFPRDLQGADIDIGLAPLRPSRFNLAKSHIKYLEYAAAGIAGIYADLPPYRGTVRDGTTGLLVSGGQWYDAICRLVEDVGFRQDIAARAQDDVRSNWLLSDHADRWYQVLDALARPRAAGDGMVSIQADEPPLVSIVIPVHGQWPYTAKCLDALRQHTGLIRHEVIVVENGVDAETETELRSMGDRVRVLTNTDNEGFAKACNRGALAARGKYLVFLNNDVEARADWLAPLVARADADPSIAVAGSKLLFPDGTIQHAGVELRYASPYPICPAHIGYRAPGGEFEVPRDVTSVTGASMLVRSAAFKAVGGFDERYENGYEDVDLCLRLREAGYRIVYEPASVLVHHGSTTVGRFDKELENLDVLHRTWMDRLSGFDRDGYAEATPSPVDPARPGVSIVVVTYNSLETIALCLEHLRLHSGPQDEVIVVDNASEDATVSYLKWYEGRYPDRLRIVCGKANLGFSRGVNLGLKEASRDYVCLLNPDVIVASGWLESMMAHLVAHGDVGAVGPLSDFVAGRQNVALHLEFGASDPERMAALLQESRAGQAVETKVLIGFCMLLRRAELLALGGLDPDLFLGHDDLDLSLRLRERGLRLLVATDAFVHHEGHKSFQRDPARGKYLVQQSANALYEKLYRAYRGKVPSGQELWDIDWFRPTEGLTSIVCLVHDNLAVTRQCVASLYEHTGREFELILVDNGSTEPVGDYAEELRETHGNVVYVRNARNEGYAYGCNQGLALAKGAFIVLLNNDVVVTPHWLGRQLALLSLDETVGIVGPRSNYIAGVQQVQDKSYRGVSDLRPFAERWFRSHAGGFTAVARVVGVSMVMRRQVVERIGGLDTGFGMGNFEDDDYCLRAVLAGFHLAVADDVFIHHHGSATFRSSGIDYPRIMAENWEIFRSKWLLGRKLPTPQDAEAFLDAWDHIPCRYQEIFHPGLEPIEPEPQGRERLLCIPDWNAEDWKRVVATYVRRFEGRDPVALVLRVEPPSPDLVTRARGKLDALLATLVASDAPAIRFETTQIPPRHRGSLYAAASAFLPCAGSRAAVYAREAEACGLPSLDVAELKKLARRLHERR